MRLTALAAVAAAATVMLAPGVARAHAGAPVPFAAGDQASARMPESPLRGREMSADRPPGSVPPGARTVPFVVGVVHHRRRHVSVHDGRDGSRARIRHDDRARRPDPAAVSGFADDHQTPDDLQMVADVTSSPLFTPMPFATGVTQYPDAFQRGNLWSQVSGPSPRYHVLLGGPRVLDTQTLEVPRHKGVTAFNTTTNRRVGIVASAWLDRRLTSLLDDLGIGSDTLPVFLAYNIAGTNGDPSACLDPRAASTSGAITAPSLRAGRRARCRRSSTSRSSTTATRSRPSSTSTSTCSATS